ncbi:hypothetical protein BJ875DRAFT_547574 [Amylocarpus encephaloides]|uniref:Uncharacterized protein n=1 Tax=Amylocarpus encephaloides TaxID=45428 RepID=A0A9P7Y870_9HELO|nr:hypothetical protein BJ875DRAFT_547574 [Amylocarpus encephaloides]
MVRPRLCVASFVCCFSSRGRKGICAPLVLVTVGPRPNIAFRDWTGSRRLAVEPSASVAKIPPKRHAWSVGLLVVQRAPYNYFYNVLRTGEASSVQLSTTCCTDRGQASTAPWKGAGRACIGCHHPTNPSIPPLLLVNLISSLPRRHGPGRHALMSRADYGTVLYVRRTARTSDVSPRSVRKGSSLAFDLDLAPWHCRSPYSGRGSLCIHPAPMHRPSIIAYRQPAQPSPPSALSPGAEPTLPPACSELVQRRWPPGAGVGEQPTWLVTAPHPPPQSVSQPVDLDRIQEINGAFSFVLFLATGP